MTKVTTQCHILTQLVPQTTIDSCLLLQGEISSELSENSVSVACNVFLQQKLWGIFQRKSQKYWINIKAGVLEILNRSDSTFEGRSTVNVGDQFVPSSGLFPTFHTCRILFLLYQNGSLIVSLSAYYSLLLALTLITLIHN